MSACFEYEYCGYTIRDNQRDGYWNILDSNNKIISMAYSDIAAEEYIDEILLSHNISESSMVGLDTQEYGNNLPVNSTTLKNLNKKYSSCIGIIYILSSEYKNKYATVNGIGNINDPDLMIFKSAETARQNRLHRHSNFGIEEVKLTNGRIEF